MIFTRFEQPCRHRTASSVQIDARTDLKKDCENSASITMSIVALLTLLFTAFTEMVWSFNQLSCAHLTSILLNVHRNVTDYQHDFPFSCTDCYPDFSCPDTCGCRLEILQTPKALWQRSLE